MRVITVSQTNVRNRRRLIVKGERTDGLKGLFARNARYSYVSVIRSRQTFLFYADRCSVNVVCGKRYVQPSIRCSRRSFFLCPRNLYFSFARNTVNGYVKRSRLYRSGVTHNILYSNVGGSGIYRAGKGLSFHLGILEIPHIVLIRLVPEQIDNRVVVALVGKAHKLNVVSVDLTVFRQCHRKNHGIGHITAAIGKIVCGGISDSCLNLKRMRIIVCDLHRTVKEYGQIHRISRSVCPVLYMIGTNVYILGVRENDRVFHRHRLDGFVPCLIFLVIKAVFIQTLIPITRSDIVAVIGSSSMISGSRGGFLLGNQLMFNVPIEGKSVFVVFIIVIVRRHLGSGLVIKVLPYFKSQSCSLARHVLL